MVDGLRASLRYASAACFALTAALAPNLAHACSGPGAGEAIALSFRVALGSLLAFAIVSVLVFAVPRLRPTTLRWKTFWIGLPLLQMIAIMLLGTARGDCGYTVRSFSFGMIGIFGMAAIAGLWVVRRRATTS